MSKYVPMHRSLPLALLLFIGFHAFSQHNKPFTSDPGKLLDCGNLSDSVTLKYRDRIIAEMYAKGSSGMRTSKEKYKIPVVVHVIEPDKSKSLIGDSTIFEGIKALNAAFSATGDYAGSLDIGIEFELAKFDPSCNPTNGITRYDASGIDWYVKNGLPYLSTNEVRGWDDWDHQSYLNIWLISRFDVVGGVGGPELGAVLPARGFFWAGSTAHEVGHFLGLNHVFPADDGACGCGDGDLIRDTPDLPGYGIGSSCSINSGCEPKDMALINPCTKLPYGDVQKNFMNYACFEQFTPDQRTFMRGMLDTFHRPLLTSRALSETQPLPVAEINGPSLFLINTSRGGVEGLSTDCICSDDQGSLTIDGNAAESYELYSVPFLKFGASKLRTYGLTCPNGSTTTKTVRFQRVGVVNIQRNCTSQGTYAVTFDNPNHFKISSSIGTVSGNSIINIPSDREVVLKAEADNGMKDSVSLEAPCCAAGVISNAKCIPASANVLDDRFGIGNFTFGNSINKNTSNAAADASYYLDYSCTEQATVNAGGSYDISVKGFGTQKYFVKIYIDFDGNGDFNGAGETILSGETSGGTANTISGKVTIPINAVTRKKLRVRVLADASPTSNACMIYGTEGGSGQIEDYSIYINGSVDPVHPGPDFSEIIQVKIKQSPDWAAGLKPFVLPNPAEGSQFDLVLPFTGSYRIKLFTRTGVPVPISIKHSNSSNQLKISGRSRLSPGLYILKIKQGENKLEQEVKVVVL